MELNLEVNAETNKLFNDLSWEIRNRTEYQNDEDFLKFICQALEEKLERLEID